METKNNAIIIGLLALILGLGIGYFTGANNFAYQMPFGIAGKSCPGADWNNEGGMHGAMGGMMTGLYGKTGDELDEAFLDGMIVHHEGAVEMAQVLLKNTKRTELVKLGNDIIAAQMQEIEMMQGWRKS